MRHFRKRPLEVFQCVLERWIVLIMPLIIRWSLRTGLGGVYVRGCWEGFPCAAVIALNHHSWWDGYLLWLIRLKISRHVGGLMDPDQLGRFRFFRKLGMIDARKVRKVLKRLQKGQSMFIFPEGELRKPGRVKHVFKGATYLSSKARVPLVPIACRVVLRGGERPEAFLNIGIPRDLENHNGTELIDDLNLLLDEVDSAIGVADPQEIPEGFVTWIRGRRPANERNAWVERFWRF